METVKDYSYGVVPIRKKDGVWQVFVVHQIARADTYWTFPKGHAEAEETHQQTALRELYEETGLVPSTLETDRVFEHAYTFTHQGTLIDKKVTYYLGQVTQDTYSLQAEEVVAAQWCTFAQARVLLTYNLAKELLDEVELFLKEQEA